MLKKTFISYLIISFMMAILSSQVTAYNTENSHAQDLDKIMALKFSFKILNQYVKVTLSRINCGEELTETELEHMKNAVQHQMHNSLKILQKPEYKQVLLMLTDKYEYLQQYEYLTTSSIEVINSQAAIKCLFPETYKASTLLGVPIGLIINLLAWIVYGIALLFEEPVPLFGLFFYAISIIMTGIGWYLIL